MKSARRRPSAKSRGKQEGWSSYYGYTLGMVEDRIRRGEFPSSETLAEILAFNSGRPLPDWLVQHVIRHLRGEIKLKRGQKPQDPWRRDFIALASWDYRRHLAWLSRRQKSQGLKGWSALRGKSWWQGSPHERALAIVHELYRRDAEEFRSIGLRRFRNLISGER